MPLPFYLIYFCIFVTIQNHIRKIASHDAYFLLMWLLRRINSAAQSYECEHSTPVRQNCATLNSLHVKTATSHKFSAQRIVGKAFTGHTQEIFQELQKSLGLVIFRFALVDLEQQRLCELL